MKRLLSRTGLFTGTLLVQSLPAMANAPEGGGAPDYSGITGLYYSLIAIVLAYGVYDTWYPRAGGPPEELVAMLPAAYGEAALDSASR